MKKLVGILLCIFISFCLFAESIELNASDFSFDDASNITLSNDGSALILQEYDGKINLVAERHRNNSTKQIKSFEKSC